MDGDHLVVTRAVTDGQTQLGKLVLRYDMAPTFAVLNRNAAIAVGVGLAAGSAQAAANEHVHLGVIGVRGQGKVLAESFAALPHSHVVSVGLRSIASARSASASSSRPSRIN